MVDVQRGLFPLKWKLLQKRPVFWLGVKEPIPMDKIMAIVENVTMKNKKNKKNNNKIIIK